MSGLRRLLAVAGAAALAVAGLTACGGGSAKSSDANTITFMAAAYSDRTEDYWKKLIAQFEQDNPGKHVDLSVVSWNDYDQRVATLLANKQQSDLLNYNTWSGYAQSDLLYSVDQVVSPEVAHDFLPSFLQDDSLHGTAYALPFIASARALYYNKRIFAKAGITTAPRTWAEFAADATAIEKAGYTGYALPLGSEEAQGEFGLWAFNGGGGWQSDGIWSINSGQNVETAQFLNDLVNKQHVTQDNPWATNRTDGAWQPFAAGRVGMVFGFPGTFGQMLDKAGLTAADYGIAQPPTASSSIPSTTLGVQDILVAFKNSPDKRPVLKAFLDFFYQQDNYTQFLTSEGFLPTNRSAGSALAKDQELGPFIKLLPNAKFAPISDPAWTSVAGQVKQGIGEIAKPGADVHRVLDGLQASAESAEPM